MIYSPSATKKMPFLQNYSFLAIDSACFTFFSLKQSIAFYMYSSESLSNIFELFRAFLASFLRIIKGRLFPSAFSISSIPKAITSAS